MMVQLDDFDVIRGVDFLMRAKASPMVHLGGILVFDEMQPCFVRQFVFSRLQDKGKSS